MADTGESIRAAGEGTGRVLCEVTGGTEDEAGADHNPDPDPDSDVPPPAAADREAERSCGLLLWL